MTIDEVNKKIKQLSDREICYLVSSIQTKDLLLPWINAKKYNDAAFKNIVKICKDGTEKEKEEIKEDMGEKHAPINWTIHLLDLLCIPFKFSSLGLRRDFAYVVSTKENLDRIFYASSTDGSTASTNADSIMNYYANGIQTNDMLEKTVKQYRELLASKGTITNPEVRTLSFDEESFLGLLFNEKTGKFTKDTLNTLFENIKLQAKGCQDKGISIECNNKEIPILKLIEEKPCLECIAIVKISYEKNTLEVKLDDLESILLDVKL